MTTTNGHNDFNVSFGDISFFKSRVLKSHCNVDINSINRTHDILFTIRRIKQNDFLKIICLREYVIGIDRVLEILAKFRELNHEINIIYIGGGWNSYTSEAKSFCVKNNIGLFVTDEMTGALFSNEYWNYHKKDKDGNPIYFGGSPT